MLLESGSGTRGRHRSGPRGGARPRPLRPIPGRAEPQAAAAAFDRYLSDATFSTNQLRFVQLIVKHPTANGVMEVARLYESPFTDNAPQGPDVIFTEDQVDDLVAILGQVRDRALPDLTVA